MSAEEIDHLIDRAVNPRLNKPDMSLNQQV